MSQKHSGSILVVDDDPVVLKFTELLLHKQGYAVSAYDNAEDALKGLQQNIIDVVLTDIVMPGITGIKLLEHVRAVDPDIPVILVTGYADMDKAIDAIKKGAFDFITKPYSSEQLTHALEKAVRYRRLIRMERDYKQTLEELNQELDTLIAERSMNLMALTVADRVRNPITTIGWVCKRLVAKEGVTESLREGLGIILDETEKLETIVKEFHEFLKNKESMFRYESINGVVEEVISVIGKESAYKGVDLVANLSGEALKINMEKKLFRAAIVHVMRNALEATPAGGRVTVTTSGDGDNVVLEVSDTGHGIAKEEIDKIFDPFFSTKKHRFGMGLSLVKQIVSEHMGEITVESDIGKGTTIKMTFPVRWTKQYSGPKGEA